MQSRDALMTVFNDVLRQRRSIHVARSTRELQSRAHALFAFVPRIINARVTPCRAINVFSCHRCDFHLATSSQRCKSGQLYRAKLALCLQSEQFLQKWKTHVCCELRLALCARIRILKWILTDILTFFSFLYKYCVSYKRNLLDHGNALFK